MRFLLLVTLSALSLSGCAMHSEKASLSSGQIGCAPSQITISDDDVTFRTASWVATCKGKRFYCVRKAYDDTNCSKELE